MDHTLYREWRKINPNNQGPMTFLREKMRSGDDIRRAKILSFAYDSHSINRFETGACYIKSLVFFHTYGRYEIEKNRTYHKSKPPEFVPTYRRYETILAIKCNKPQGTI